LLDGDWLVRTHGIAFDSEPLAEARLGAALAEISRKPFCAAKQTIAAVDAFMLVLAEGVAPRSIASVKVIVPTIYRAMIARAPVGRQDRIASVGYQLALAAYRRDDLFDVERPKYDDARLVEFVERVDVVADPSLDHFYPRRWPARVELELVDGSRRVIQVESACGDPDRPLTNVDLDSKFLRLSTPAIGEGAARELLDSCRSASEDAGALERIAAKLSNGSQ
jgi:2-methylcitrate dehydratase PrpD